MFSHSKSIKQSKKSEIVVIGDPISFRDDPVPKVKYVIFGFMPFPLLE